MGWYGYTKKKPKNPMDIIEKLRKKNADLSPVHIEGNKIATSWWGMAWNRNLERYADYSSRLSRGRSYVRQDMVVDLQIQSGTVTALVCGTKATPYKITITIKPMEPKALDALMAQCSSRISDMGMLLDGKFSKDLGDLFFRQEGGLFPSPREIKFDCSCPDWTSLCKHVAATLYAVSAKLDEEPLLFFTLRNINVTKLLKKTAEERVHSLLKNAQNATDRMIPMENIEDIFQW